MQRLSDSLPSLFRLRCRLSRLSTPLPNCEPTTKRDSEGTPALAANRLARWALLLSQYDYSIEYRKTSEHGNTDALSRLPAGPDTNFDGEESGADIDTICTIKTIGMQLNPTDPGVLTKESAKDRVIATVMRYTREGWSPSRDSSKSQDSRTNSIYNVENFRKLIPSLSTSDGCLFYGCRVVIPENLQRQVLELLHLEHFGVQRMKQLARTAVYWPGIDNSINDMGRSCTSCGNHQNLPNKAPIHPWMLPEQPWSRLHLDHAINFLGSNWLVAYLLAYVRRGHRARPP